MTKMPELNPCPFCGHTPKLEHDRIECCRNSENGDLITRWKVRCLNCGIEQIGGVTEYRFMSDETLEIINTHFDGRNKAIEYWNRRVEND